MAELLPAPEGAGRCSPALRHRPQHRRRGGRPAGTLARPAGSALLRPRSGRLERHRLRRPGLPEARPFVLDCIIDLARAQRPPADDPAGQGRLLGQRDQARPGRRAGRLPRLHPQGPHRRLLPRLRPQAAGGARRRLPAIRHPQRPDAGRHPRHGGRQLHAGQYEFQCLHGMGEPLYEEVVGNDKLTGPAASTPRSAPTRPCWPTWCGGCWRTAPTPPSSTASPTPRCRSRS